MKFFAFFLILIICITTHVSRSCQTRWYIYKKKQFTSRKFRAKIKGVEIKILERKISCVNYLFIYIRIFILYKDYYIRKMDTKQELFREKNKKRKQQNLKLYYLGNKLVVNDQIKMTEKTLERILDCGSYLEFLADENLEKRKLYTGIFCKNRFCPICSKKKSLNDALAIKIITEYIRLELKREFILVTLTAPNIIGENLKNEITKYNKAVDRLFKRKKYNVVKGYLRKLEVTYNKKKNTYHPHFHVLISVDKSYFKNVKVYLKRDTWLRDWQEVMYDDSITQVDVRRVKMNNNEEIGESVLELTKYIAKDSNYLENEEVFKYFYIGLRGKRMYSFGGDFKLAKEKFKKGELDYLIPEDKTKWYYLIKSIWFNNEYSEIIGFIENNIKFDEIEKENIF